MANVRRGTYRSDVTPWDDARSTDESGTNIGNNGTVEVGHDHDVELLGLGDQLHGTVGDRVNVKTRRVIAQKRTCYRRSCHYK